MDDYLRKGGPIPPPDMPTEKQTDPYGFGAKAIGNPMGQPTVFVGDRPLRDCIFGTTWDHRGPVADTDTDLGAVLVTGRMLPDDRALYIPRLFLTSFILTNFDLDSRWQLYADGKFIHGAPWEAASQDIDIFFPPRTQVTFYFRVVNNVGANVFFDYAVQWVEFNAGDDIWKWGTGSNIANPAAGAVVWP